MKADEGVESHQDGTVQNPCDAGAFCVGKDRLTGEPRKQYNKHKKKVLVGKRSAPIGFGSRDQPPKCRSIGRLFSSFERNDQRD